MSTHPASDSTKRSCWQQFGVSRTPLREALIQLASLGLIELRPRRGAVVAEVSPQQLIEMFEVMGELEAMCSRLAARRITEAEQKELLAAHQACKAAAGIRRPGCLLLCQRAVPLRYLQRGPQFFPCRSGPSAASQASRLPAPPAARAQSYGELVCGAWRGVVAAILAGNGDVAAERIRKHVLVRASGSAISSPRSRSSRPDLLGRRALSSVGRSRG